ncbi:MAG: exodeoxyribonuclease VII large subunit, partial [Clostridia bacterium]|nr:exodeoxyribonuclease VII large subunit [Clostridia bacterium]
MSFAVLTVTQLNFYAKSLLEGDERLQRVWLRGEISNFTNHYRSGHLYLSLKDESAAVRAVMFKNSAARLSFAPYDGMRVVASGRVSIYERDGQYQFYIDDMQPDGLGAMYLAYEQLRERLRAEGLFDDSRKRPLPDYPARIGVVTSEQGAALQDILNILKRRWPVAQVLLYPVQVQGAQAPGQICEAIDYFSRTGAADVVIAGRGGGSLEDLWAFNDERVARSIAACTVPVVSAVGHETDFTIADFASDLRAPTPSAAAEIVSPDITAVGESVTQMGCALRRLLEESIAAKSGRLHALTQAKALRSPLFALDAHRMRVDLLQERLYDAAFRIVSSKKSGLAGPAAKLDALSPLRVIARGYAAVFDEAGAAVTGVGSMHA